MPGRDLLSAAQEPRNTCHDPCRDRLPRPGVPHDDVPDILVRYPRTTITSPLPSENDRDMKRHSPLLGSAVLAQAHAPGRGGVRCERKTLQVGQHILHTSSCQPPVRLQCPPAAVAAGGIASHVRGRRSRTKGAHLVPGAPRFKGAFAHRFRMDDNFSFRYRSSPPRGIEKPLLTLTQIRAARPRRATPQGRRNVRLSSHRSPSPGQQTEHDSPRPSAIAAPEPHGTPHDLRHGLPP